MKNNKYNKHKKNVKRSKKIKTKNYSKNKTKKNSNKRSTRRRTIKRGITKKINKIKKQKGGTIEEINSGLYICEKLKRGIDQIKQDILMHEFNIKSALETPPSEEREENIKTWREFLKNSLETLSELEQKFSIKKDEMFELVERDVELINEMNAEEQEKLLTKIEKVLNFGFKTQPEMKQESTETELIKTFVNYNEIFTENEVNFSKNKKDLDEQLKEVQSAIERNNATSNIAIPGLKEMLNKLLQDIDKTLSAITLFENKINNPNTEEETKIKLENKLKELNAKVHELEESKTSIQSKLLKFKVQKKEFENILETLNKKEKNLNKAYELNKTEAKNHFLLYLNTMINLIGKILFEPNANLETKLKIKGTLSLFGINPESIKPEYEKNKLQQMTTATQTAEEMAEQLIREEDEARILKAQQKKLQQKPIKEKLEKTKPQPQPQPLKQQAVVKPVKKQESVLPDTTTVQQEVVKEKSLKEASIKKQELKKQKATISRIILDYWRPIIKNYLDLPGSVDINIMSELLNIKDYVKQMIRDEIPPESGITSNSCTQLLKIIKNYSGIEKQFQEITQNITRETCMIGIVMAFISNILEKSKLCILLLKGSASIQIYTEQIKQIQDLDFIILPYIDDAGNSSLNAQQQKELAFQISSLVIWLLSDTDINLLLINTFKNTLDTSDRIPKQLINIDDAKQFKIMINDENKQLFDSLQIDKGDNVKIVLTINPSVEGGTYRYYPIIDIGYGFDIFEPGLQKIYRENIEKTIPSSTDSGLSFNYLKMEGLFDEICYHLLSYYFSGKEAENSFYISKVAGYLSVILPLTDGYICDPKKPVEVETCVINIILQNLNEIYYEYLLGLYPTTNKDELKPIFKNVVNGIYNNKKTQFINKIVDNFFTS